MVLVYWQTHLLLRKTVAKTQYRDSVTSHIRAHTE